MVDVLEKNVPHLNRVLETLSVEEHSLSVVAVLLAKLNQPWNNASADRVIFFFIFIYILLWLIDLTHLKTLPHPLSPFLSLNSILSMDAKLWVFYCGYVQLGVQIWDLC